MVLFVLLLASMLRPQEVKHRILFTFDYDFTAVPACAPSIKKNCVKQFNFYDISIGVARRTKLGSMPVPESAKGPVKSISGASDWLVFNPGKHRVALGAQLENGAESDLNKCSTIVTIP